MWLEPVTLRGKQADLLPLSMEYCEGLIDAVNDGELWRLWYTFIPEPDKMGEEIERRLQLQATGSMVPFVVIENEHKTVAGMTTYMQIDHQTKRAEIGSTWYRKNVQRTGVNTECKLLLLQHAFETLDCVAVEFRTSWMNHQSRRGIERLGAKLDGVLRSHAYHSNGTLRDTCIYSIIAAEWPTVKAYLQHELERPRQSAADALIRI